MPSYVITGVSRGIGFGFLEKLSSNPSNTVIGLVRDVTATKAKIDPLKRSNIHILKGDMYDYASLKKAAEDTAAITSGSVDYLIANAGLISEYSAYATLSELGEKDVEGLTQDLLDSFNTNVVGNIHLFNLFMPLVLKGKGKKVVTISTGMADQGLTVEYGLAPGAPYAISKAAMNMAAAKYQAEYEKDGVLFLSISPGSVNTGQYDNMSEEQQKGAAVMGEKFVKYAPHFKGPITVDESVEAVMKVIDNASLEKGDAGAFLSHTGNKSWL